MDILSPRPFQRYYSELWNWRHGLSRRIGHFLRQGGLSGPQTRLEAELDGLADKALADGDEEECLDCLLKIKEREEELRAKRDRLHPPAGDVEQPELPEAETPGSPSVDHLKNLVTLDQAATLVNRSKSTLRKLADLPQTQGDRTERATQRIRLG